MDAVPEKHRDVRLNVLRGCALADLGRDAEAISLLRPVHIACMELVAPAEIEEDEDEARAQRRRIRRRMRRHGVPEGSVYGDNGPHDTRIVTDARAHGDHHGDSDIDKEGESEGEAEVGMREAERKRKGSFDIITSTLGKERFTWLTLRLARALWRHRSAAAAYAHLQPTVELCLRPGDGKWQLEHAQLDAMLALLSQVSLAAGELSAAYGHARALCMRNTGSPAAWTLFNCICSQARLYRFDARPTLRALLRNRDGHHIALAVAHRYLLSRSFGMAVTEYARIHTAVPNEPLLPLCVAVAEIQLALSSKNSHKGHDALAAFSWLDSYSQLRSNKMEVAYNTARAYHHLGLVHLAAPLYAQVLVETVGAESTGARGKRKRRRRGERVHERVAVDEREAEGEHAGVLGERHQSLAFEAARNLSSICSASGSDELSRQIVRRFMVV